MQTLFSRHQHQLMRLTEQLQSRLSLREALASCLTAKAQAALLDAYIDGDTLHLLTSNASWASRLRLSSRQLIKASQHPQVKKLVVHIAAQTSENQPSNRVFERIPADTQALEHLKALSEQLDPAEALTQSLNRLIKVMLIRSQP